MCRYPVYNEFLKELQISSSRFFKSSILRLLYQKEGWTVWVESTHHKKDSENASVKFVQISRVQRIPQRAPNVLNKSQKSLWQCIRLVCMCRYPVYNEFLKELQISSSRFYKRSVSKLIYPKRRSALWVECTHRKIFWECFSLVCMWRYPVCNEFLKEIQISLSRFYTSSVSRMLYEKEGWILWVKSTHHKKVSENASV